MASGGHSSSRCAGLSLSRPLLLRSTGSRRTGSVVVAHGLSCSAACGIFPDQGLNPCPLHWQADSQPLHHQGSPRPLLLRSTGSRRTGGMWDLPRPGLKPVSPALAGRFSTTAPPGKPSFYFLKEQFPSRKGLLQSRRNDVQHRVDPQEMCGTKERFCFLKCMKQRSAIY